MYTMHACMFPIPHSHTIPHVSHIPHTTPHHICHTPHSHTTLHLSHTTHAVHAHTHYTPVFLNIVKRNTDRRTPLKHSFCPSWLPCPCLKTTRKTLIEEWT